MNSPVNEICPLCAGPAEFIQINLHRKHFKCQSCTEFVLWRNVEGHLARMASSERQKFSASAKATTNPNYIYVISSRLPKSPPHIDIEGRVLLRSEALAP